MAINCNCEIDYDYANANTHCPAPTLETLEGKHGRKCWSCQKLIRLGDLSREFYMEKPIEDGYVSIPSEYLCEACNIDYNFITGMDWCFEFGESLQKQLEGE